MALVVVDVDGFMRAWKAMHDKMDAFGAIAFKQAVKQALEAQKEYGYQNKTGRLTSKMKPSTSQSGAFGYKGSITTSVPYALYVDKGTKPHVIRAKGKGLLHFYWPKVGRWVAFKQVNHPGFRGAAFTSAAIQRFGQTAGPAIEQAFKDAAN